MTSLSHRYKILLTILAGLICMVGMASDLNSRRISTRDGLSSNKVFDMVQDPDGYMWLGADNALCRYDGYQMVVIDFMQIGSEKVRANVGNLYIDERQQLLWVRTVNYNYGCYNLRMQRFEDYTCGADALRSYRRCLISQRGFWMYDDGVGIRHVDHSKMKYHLTDYTKENGNLISNHVKKLFEDKESNIWAILDKGIARIDNKGKVSVFLPSIEVSCGNSTDSKCFFITASNHLLVFSLDGRQLKDMALPDDMRATDLKNSSFFWQNKWVLPAQGYVAVMNCGDFSFSRPEEMQLHSALLLDSENGNYVLGDGGTLCLFPDKGKAKRMTLMQSTLYTGTRSRKFTTRIGNDGRFYIASYGNGLYIYDPKTDATEHHQASDPQPAIVSNYLINLTCDRSGGVWVSMEDAGLAVISGGKGLQTKYLHPISSNDGDWWLTL